MVELQLSIDVLFLWDPIEVLLSLYKDKQGLLTMAHVINLLFDLRRRRPDIAPPKEARCSAPPSDKGWSFVLGPEIGRSLVRALFLSGKWCSGCAQTQGVGPEVFGASKSRFRKRNDYYCSLQPTPLALGFRISGC